MPRVVPSEVVAFIDRVFPWAEQHGSDHAAGSNVAVITLAGDHFAQLRAVLVLADSVPDELLTMPPDSARAFLVSKEAIRGRTFEWTAAGHTRAVGAIEGFGNLNPVAWIRLALSRCPDEIPAAATHRLAFIVGQDDFRESLRIDIDTIGRALANQEWKPATVLAGSVIEALLLWRLEQDDIAAPGRTEQTARRLRLRHATDPLTARGASPAAFGGRCIPAGGVAPPLNTPGILGRRALPAGRLARLGATPDLHHGLLNDWLFHEMIAVAAEHGHVIGDTLIAVRLAQNFRNLIHPGRAARLAEACNRGTAYSTVGAMERVITDFT